MRKVELLPTRDCEAGYGPDLNILELLTEFIKIIKHRQSESTIHFISMGGGKICCRFKSVL